ncbi:hypothetical protein LCGC14_1344160 [marine sediment metagenome]|uniref:Bacteriophage Mu GpT domain-containing protein n=1 Tax=marine sediment metagenome TaxID=412755 RepID=A0A0F9KDH3_9ZZZZ
MTGTGATEFIDSTTADVFIPELWSPLALIAREQNLVFAHKVDRRFEGGLTWGDLIHVPSVGNLSARAKAKSSNAAILYETITETNTDITIATWEYTAIAVESIVKIQNNRDQLAMYAGKMGYGLALSIDNVLAGLVDDFTQTVGTLAVENTDTEYIRSRQFLRDADAPNDSIFWCISPAAMSGLLKLDKFVRDDYSGVHGPGRKETGLQQAYVTSIYGDPVYVSTNVEGSNAAGHDNTIMQREALALVVQMQPTPWFFKDIDFFVDKVALEQLSGTREMRDDHGVFIKGA